MTSYAHDLLYTCHEGAHKPCPPKPAAKKPDPAPKPFKQAQLTSRISMKTIDTSDALYKQEAVAPELTPENAVGRFILAPPSVWPDHTSDNTGGFVGRIEKCLKQAQQPTTIKFKDGRFNFAFATVKKDFKTLT